MFDGVYVVVYGMGNGVVGVGMCYYVGLCGFGFGYDGVDFIFVVLGIVDGVGW